MKKMSSNQLAYSTCGVIGLIGAAIIFAPVTSVVASCATTVTLVGLGVGIGTISCKEIEKRKLEELNKKDDK